MENSHIYLSIASGGFDCGLWEDSSLPESDVRSAGKHADDGNPEWHLKGGIEEDEFGLHFGVFIDEKLISIVSCFISDDEMQFRKLATLPEYQGQGIASELLKHIFELAGKKNLKRISREIKVH